MKKIIAFFVGMLIALNTVVLAYDYDDGAFYELDINKTAGYLPVGIGCDIQNKSGIAAETRMTVNKGVPQGQTAWNCYWLVLTKADGATKTFNSSWSGGKGLDSAVMSVGKTYIIRDVLSYGKDLVRYIIDEESGEVLKQTLKSTADDDCKYTAIKEIRMSNIDSKPLNVTVHDFKVYDISMTRTGISIGSDNVRTDEDITVTFNRKIASDTVNNVFLYDSNNNEVEINVEQNDRTLIISPVGGLEYNTDYILKLTSDLKNEMGVGLIEEEIEFTTEQPPYRFDVSAALDGSTIVLSGVAVNLSPYEIKQGCFVLGYDEEGTLITADSAQIVMPAECGKLEIFEKTDIDENIAASIKRLKVVSPSALKEFSEAVLSDTEITNGFIDRVFSTDRYVYYVERCDNSTKIVLKNAQLVTEDDTKCIYELDGKNYIFNKVINERAELSDVTFVNDNTVSVKTKNAKGEIIITKPLEKFSQAAFDFSALENDVSEDKLLDIIDCSGDETEYTFPANAYSGAYGFIIDDNFGGTVFSSIYYADNTDLENALSEIKAIQGSDESLDKKKERMKKFISDNEKLLKLDLTDYSAISDSGFVCEYILKSSIETLGDFSRCFEAGTAVARFNQLDDKYEAVKKYKNILGVETADDINNINGLDKIIKKTLSGKKAQNEADVKKIYYNACAVERINESDRQRVLSVFESGLEFLEITSSAMKKYNDTKDKANIITALVNKEFLSDSEISTAIINAPEISSGNKNNGGSGSSSSSGKKTSVTAYVVKDKEADEKNDEEKTQENNDIKAFDFTDVTAEHWAYNAIAALSKLQIINGKGDNKFAPSDNVLREEFVKMLVLVLDLDHSSEESVFSDCPVGSWYNQYICAAFKNKLVNGIDENNFGTGSSITRQDMAVMIDKAITAKELNTDKIREYTGFPDEADISEYAADAVKRLYETGLINGMENVSFKPKDTLTRAMAAEVLNNLYILIN